jgi:dTMP kinase
MAEELVPHSARRRRIAIAAVILLMPGGFLMGTALFMAWLGRRRGSARRAALLNGEGRKMRGCFIVVEGPDGSGKTTAARGMAARLEDKGYDVIVTRNVGGTQVAEELRRLLLDPEYAMDPLTQASLTTAARRSNLVQVILPALAQGKVVVCDRYVASTLVFQTLNAEAGGTVTDGQVLDLHRILCDDVAPDVTLHVHAPSDVRNERRRIRAEGLDRFDNGDAEYDRRISDKYAKAGEILGHHTVDVDGSGTIRNTIDLMLEAVRPHLPTGA